MKKIFNFQFSIFNSDRGQTLLIVVLVMVVALTVGLSVASRSITNLRTATEEENSQRAFFAAEAGVERALQTSTSVPESQLGNNASIKKATIVDIGGDTKFVINGGNDVTKDDGVDIRLSNYPDYTNQWSGTLTIYWGNVSNADCSNAGLEIVVLSGSLVSSAVTSRYVYDPCSTRSNNFTLVSAGPYTIGSKSFKYKTPGISISLGFLARIIPLYASSPIGIEGNVVLPIQGKLIQSTGASGGTVRQVTYFQEYPQLPPEFFQYILFQPSSSL